MTFGGSLPTQPTLILILNTLLCPAVEAWERFSGPFSLTHVCISLLCAPSATQKLLPQPSPYDLLQKRDHLLPSTLWQTQSCPKYFHGQIHHIFYGKLLGEDNTSMVNHCKNLVRCTLSARHSTRARSWEMVTSALAVHKLKLKEGDHLDLSLSLGAWESIQEHWAPAGSHSSTIQHRALVVPCVVANAAGKPGTKEQIHFQETQNTGKAQLK